MVVPAQLRTTSNPVWHARFLTILPAILRQARVAFRDFDPEQREDATADVVANAFAAYARLVELDREQFAFPTPLAQYAIRQYFAGRRVGTQSNTLDMCSPAALRKHGHVIERLDRFDHYRGAWVEILIEDRRATPADTAAMRIDFVDWLRSLPSRLRRIALFLSTGETTSAAAKQFRVSRGRISQIRRELLEAWETFQSPSPVAAS